MLKWFEKVDKSRPAVISSRVRLARNWDVYPFPSKLNESDGAELVRRLE